jgi:DNA-binding NarL/FixJ family response regulator
VNGVLCPVIVGRERELTALTKHLEAAVDGRGGFVALVGEAGIGKSRLAGETVARANSCGILVLSGRSVPGGSPPPFRPLTEAFLVAMRGSRPSQGPELAGFAAQLTRLVPDWETSVSPGIASADESPVLVGEAVVRLLRTLGGDAGCLLVLEDLQWADPETLAVADFLVDTLGAERILCLVTARPAPGHPVSDLLDRVRDRRAGVVLGLEPLSAGESDRMVAACLATARAPAELNAFVVEHSDGLPFLVEELLAGVVASGALVFRDGEWSTERRPTPAIPSSLAGSVRSRLRAFDQIGWRVLAAAAVLGRRFDWQLLPGVAEVDGAVAVDALRQAVNGQLVTVEGQQFRFRHALTREAVLAELLPPERGELSARALVGIERAHPRLPGPWCELAAELAEAAGDTARASGLLAESARRALARGALSTAELTAERARQLAPAGSTQAADADEVLVHTLSAAGKPTPTRAIGNVLLDRFAKLSVPSTRRIDLLLVLARAALAAGDASAAESEVEQARQLVDLTDVGVCARLDAVGAHVALAQARVDDARRLASTAATRAEAAGVPEVECEAVEVLGRLAERATDRVVLFERAAHVAERHGLTTWRLRALHELALTEAATGGFQRVREVRLVAEDAGAFHTVAQMDLLVADLSLATFNHDACLAAAQRCVAASRRYGLSSLPVALLWLAGAHALGGREAEMEAVLTEAARSAPDDPRVLADAWGRVRSTHLALREDRPALRSCLEESMRFTRVAPDTESLYPGQMTWALLRALLDDDLGMPARAEVAESHMVRRGFGRPLLQLIDAVVLGRQGSRDAAADTAAAADTELTSQDARSWSMYALRLTAEAAVRDGWGGPEGWLREAEAFFAGRGYERVARECRTLLRAVGAPVPRRGRGHSDVPAGMRRLGITSREVDVLALVADGLATREIAARLYLSPRTVEHHVAHLLTRTGLRTRAELAEFARATRVAPAP